MGLMLADAYCNGVERMRVRGDSQLAIGLLNGSKQSRQPLIESLMQIPLELKTKFRLLEGEHIPRGYNAKADRLATAGLGVGRGKGK